ncbi:unnamed protein product [Echinostoma caproni]|uniref:Ornithine cyclodeaminase n=1 Tax=Echinostoma caproni TaxID=27848 RepID=A0A183AT44_9TREM|nr:unnamed protein product [Echinostoma caproni]
MTQVIKSTHSLVPVSINAIGIDVVTDAVIEIDALCEELRKASAVKIRDDEELFASRALHTNTFVVLTDPFVPQYRTDGNAGTIAQWIAAPFLYARK